MFPLRLIWAVVRAVFAKRAAHGGVDRATTHRSVPLGQGTSWVGCVIQVADLQLSSRVDLSLHSPKRTLVVGG
jgi:hypothetical protein